MLKDFEAGKVEFTFDYEDIHDCIEQKLEEKIGRVARKLNWSRSVNDQVVIDTRLFLREENSLIQESLKELMETLEKLAEEHVNTIMPGYSHLQRAQPITLGYHLLIAGDVALVLLIGCWMYKKFNTEFLYYL